MKRKTSPPTFVEYAVLAIFAGIVVLGVSFAVSRFLVKNVPAGARPGATATNTPPRVAPTAAQYEAEVRAVMTPFLEQAQKMTPADFASDNAAMQDLVTKTQERMLAVIVPKEYRNAHLSFILLFDQWKSALSGSSKDQKAVLQKTADVVAANPWLTSSSAAPVK